MKHNKESKFKEKIKNSHQTISSPERPDLSDGIVLVSFQWNCSLVPMELSQSLKLDLFECPMRVGLLDLIRDFCGFEVFLVQQQLEIGTNTSNGIYLTSLVQVVSFGKTKYVGLEFTEMVSRQ